MSPLVPFNLFRMLDALDDTETLPTSNVSPFLKDLSVSSSGGKADNVVEQDFECWQVRLDWKPISHHLFQD